MKNNKKIRLLLVDDHPIVLEGIRSLLGDQDNMEVVGEASDGEEAIGKAKKLAPDIVLMDVSMPGMSGLKATEILGKTSPQIKVLALTMHDSKEYALSIVRSGAKGYILKDASPLELIRAVELVYGGDSYFSSRVSQFLLNDYVKEVGNFGKRGKR